MPLYDQYTKQIEARTADISNVGKRERCVCACVFSCVFSMCVCVCVVCSLSVCIYVVCVIEG